MLSKDFSFTILKISQLFKSFKYLILKQKLKNKFSSKYTHSIDISYKLLYMLLSIINNTSVSMSIEISKIIDVYDQSISIVSAKNELFIDNPSTISSQTEIISRPS